MSATKTLLESTITDIEDHLEYLTKDKERFIKNVESTEIKIAQAISDIADLKNSLANMKS
ncbi:MAG: hypothetical protein E2O79_09980 [Caldithrix sp.]|nr:MAG: hypothetical protein E2O79_09980 [Caldithrix sp.]